MKKLMTMMMAFAIVLSMAACGKAETTVENKSEPEMITIQAFNANKEITDIEVPYDPQRIAILDMPARDIIDALGLGDRIVGSAKVSIEYLKDYNPDADGSEIVNLGTVKTADLEKVAACEPDVIFIGGRLDSVYADL